MSLFGQFQFPVYFVGVTLFMFFYGYFLIFKILKKLKIKDQLGRFIFFVILVIIASLSIEYITKFFIGLDNLGEMIIVGFYIATYLRYEKEMRRRY